MYIAKNLHNQKAANDLPDAVENAIMERQPVAEAFELYHFMREGRYPWCFGEWYIF